MVPNPLLSSGRCTLRVFEPALAGVVPLYGVVGGTDVSGIPGNMEINRFNRVCTDSGYKRGLF